MGVPIRPLLLRHELNLDGFDRFLEHLRAFLQQVEVCVTGKVEVLRVLPREAESQDELIGGAWQCKNGCGDLGSGRADRAELGLCRAIRDVADQFDEQLDGRQGFPLVSGVGREEGPNALIDVRSGFLELCLLLGGCVTSTHTWLRLNHMLQFNYYS